MAKIKSEPKSQIQRIRDVYPRYADLIEKNAALVARQEQLIAEIKPLSEEQRRSQVSWTAQLPKPKPRPVVRHAGAVSLVGDLLTEQAPEEISPPAPRPNWPGEENLRALGEESEAISEAFKLLTPELTKARIEYSKLVATQRGEEYISIAEAVIDATRALGDAIIQHHNFITEQRLDGVAYRKFRPLNLERFGNLNESGQPLLRTILDAVDNKLVSAGKIPDWKMPADIALFAGGN